MILFRTKIRTIYLLEKQYHRDEITSMHLSTINLLNRPNLVKYGRSAMDKKIETLET
jgi:hypothetical protein